jgi:predicted transcriptional regulator
MPFVSKEHLKHLTDQARAHFYATHLPFGHHPETGDKFFVPLTDLFSGTLLQGVQGVGKSGLMENLIAACIRLEQAVIVVDPHGDLVDHAIAQLPDAVIERVRLLDMTDEEYPFGVNVFAGPQPGTSIAQAQRIDRIVHIFNVLWPETENQQNLPRYLRAAIISLLANPGSTLVDMYRLLKRPHAKRLSIALVVIMLTGVIMAGVDQVVTLNSHVATVVDTILLIARAVMAVLYSRVIHSLRGDETPQLIQPDALEAMRTDSINQLADTLSRQLEERITKQTETLTKIVETALAQRPHVERAARPVERPTKVRSITEAASRRRAVSDSQSTDKVVWPLLDAGQSVRAIASQTTISAGRVERSRKRWKTAQAVSMHAETDDQPSAVLVGE